MRRCRYHSCRKLFEPAKHFYYYCSWDCRVADVGADYQRHRDQSYDRGYHDAWQAKTPGSEIPHGIWRGMILLCHPDKYEQEPGLKTLAGEITRWLLEHRPGEKPRV
jgi:hypothetical protein